MHRMFPIIITFFKMLSFPFLGQLGDFSQVEEAYMGELAKLSEADMSLDRFVKLQQMLADFMVELGLYAPARWDHRALIHWSRNKMVNILQTKLEMRFIWKKWLAFSNLTHHKTKSNLTTNPRWWPEVTSQEDSLLLQPHNSIKSTPILLLGRVMTRRRTGDKADPVRWRIYLTRLWVNTVSRRYRQEQRNQSWFYW